MKNENPTGSTTTEKSHDIPLSSIASNALGTVKSPPEKKRRYEKKQNIPEESIPVSSLYGEDGRTDYSKSRPRRATAMQASKFLTDEQ